MSRHERSDEVKREETERLIDGMYGFIQDEQNRLEEARTRGDDKTVKIHQAAIDAATWLIDDTQQDLNPQ